MQAMKPEDSPLMNASVRHEARNVPSTAGYENMSPNLNSYFEKQQRLQAEKRRPKDEEEKRRRESEKERERQKVSRVFLFLSFTLWNTGFDM